MIWAFLYPVGCSNEPTGLLRLTLLPAAPLPPQQPMLPKSTSRSREQRTRFSHKGFRSVRSQRHTHYPLPESLFPSAVLLDLFLFNHINHLFLICLALSDWLLCGVFWCSASVNQTLLWSQTESWHASINPSFTKASTLIMNWLCICGAEKEWSLLLTESHCFLSLFVLCWFIMHAVCSQARN